MDDFLSCCEIVLRINRMEKQLEKLGIVLESNFLNNDFYGLRNDAVKLCLKSLGQLSSEDEEKVVEDLCCMDDKNFTVISRKIWNSFGDDMSWIC